VRVGALVGWDDCEVLIMRFVYESPRVCLKSHRHTFISP